MKLLDCLNISKADNKYDAAIRAFYAVFYIAGFIVFFAVGLEHMKLRTWILAFVCAFFGATVYGAIAKGIINFIRRDRKDSKPDALRKLLQTVFFAVATVAFIAVGVQENQTKTWLIAFVGAYGGAFIFTVIAQLIIFMTQKETR